jgi:fatty-acid desaturase
MLTHKKHFLLVQIPIITVGIYAIFNLFSENNYAWLLSTFVFWFIAYVLGEGITYHRYFGHDSFRFKWPMMPKIISLFCIMSGFGNPINWRSTHKYHHLYADTDKDPHTPKDSIWHGIFGWHLVNRDIDLLHCRRLLSDRYYVWISKNTIPIWYSFAILFYFIHPMLFVYTIGLGGLIGFILVAQVTTLSHLYGTKKFPTNDNGRNITWLSWITWVGSGALQNNHHAFPWRWHDSHVWYEFDIGKYIIPLIATDDLKKL